MRETLVGITPHDKLLNILVTLAIARPDYTEALAAVAGAVGLRKTFLGELPAEATQLIIIERPTKALTGGEL